jgi:hypothetical protein
LISFARRPERAGHLFALFPSQRAAQRGEHRDPEQQLSQGGRLSTVDKPLSINLSLNACAQFEVMRRMG